MRALAQSEFRERAPRWMDGTFPWDNMKQLAELGVLGMAVPEEYGGLGLPVFDTALVLEEIAKACYVTAMAVLGEVGVQTRIISHYAPEAIKRRILPEVCSGEAILAICMTEPDAGTDVANYKTNTDRVGNKLRLNGVKTLISRADEAAMFVVFTRVDRKPGREGIGCVLVEKGTPGFSVTGTYHTMGGENLHEIRFEDVELPPENLVLGGRFPQTAQRLQHAALPQPEHLAGPRRGRVRGGGQIRQGAQRVRPRRSADFQGMRWKTGRDVPRHRGRAARSSTAPAPAPTRSPTRSWPPPPRSTVNEMALRVTSEAIQVHGGYGFTDEFPVSRFYRGARYGTLGGGTTETLKDLIGQPRPRRGGPGRRHPGPRRVLRPGRFQPPASPTGRTNIG